MGNIIRSGNGARQDKNGWIYVSLEGTPHERGVQHGTLLATELQRAVEIGKYMANWDTGDDFTVFADAAKSWVGRLDDEYKEELQGIVKGATEKGAGVTFEELLVWNGYSELLSGWWPQNHVPPLAPLCSPREACTGAARSSPPAVSPKTAKSSWRTTPGTGTRP